MPSIISKTYKKGVLVNRRLRLVCRGRLSPGPKRDEYQNLYSCKSSIILFFSILRVRGARGNGGLHRVLGLLRAHCNIIILLLYYWATAPLSNSATGSVRITLVTDGTQIGFQLPTTELRFFVVLCHCILYTITITIYIMY